MAQLDLPRWLLGIVPDRTGQRLVGSAVLVTGTGLSLDVLEHRSASLTWEDSPLLTSAHTTSPDAALIAQTTEGVVQLVQQLLLRLGADREMGLAVALHDVGQWIDDPYLGRSYQSWCDPFQVAAQTGLNVIDQFAVTDLAAGGTGGPAELVAMWILLRERTTMPGQRVRTLLDMASGDIELWFLPGFTSHRPPVLSYLRLTADSATPAYGPRGIVAESQQTATSLTCTGQWVPRWGRIAGSPDASGRAMAERSGSAAIAAISHEVVRILRDELPVRLPVREVLLDSQLAQQGWTTALTAADDQLEVNELGELGWPNRDELRAAAIAITGALSIDRVAANPGDLLGTANPRIMGQFTPGTGARWHQLLDFMAAPLAPILQLRKAV